MLMKCAFRLIYSETGRKRPVIQRTFGSSVQRNVGNSLRWLFHLHWRQSILLSTRLWVSDYTNIRLKCH